MPEGSIGVAASFATEKRLIQELTDREDIISLQLNVFNSFRSK